MTTSEPVDHEGVRDRISQFLRQFMAERRRQLTEFGSGVEALADATSLLTSTGKRLRPAFCWWGWRGHGGADSEAAIGAAASLDLLHAGALIHDDLIDGSDTRRGRPSTHRWFATRHTEEGLHGDPRQFGWGAAILTGDVCLVWADQAYRTCGLDERVLDAGQAIFDRMRTEVMSGQFLDMLAQAEGTADVGRALQVARLKTARYTVERPLQLGAALAGASERDMRALSEYGLPLGVAFQLRDDILGVFGDPARTGKPSGDDLREGKQTVLLALASAKADQQQRRALTDLVGKPDLTDAEADEVRRIMIATGAREQVQEMAAAQAADAVAAIGRLRLADPIPALLERVALDVVDRTS